MSIWYLFVLTRDRFAIVQRAQESVPELKNVMLPLCQEHHSLGQGGILIQVDPVVLSGPNRVEGIAQKHNVHVRSPADCDRVGELHGEIRVGIASRASDSSATV